MELYLHVRVLFSMILGLGVSHLLGGVARMVQHPKAYKPYWVHLVWTVFLFLYLIHFWWWEFGLHRVREWTFPLYLFIALYAVIMYLQCTLLYPVSLSDYHGFFDYYYSRQAWIFGLMALLFVADFVDTLAKGVGYLETLGPLYYVRTGSCLFLCLAAMKVKNHVFHAAFAVYATAAEIVMILHSYRTIQ
jgi:hypothetical protein